MMTFLLLVAVVASGVGLGWGLRGYRADVEQERASMLRDAAWDLRYGTTPTWTGNQFCTFCHHMQSHHDQPDCWECTNQGVVCELEVKTWAHAYEPSAGSPHICAACEQDARVAHPSATPASTP